MKKSFALLFLSFFLLSAGCSKRQSPAEVTPAHLASPFREIISVGNQKIFASIVSDPAGMQQGLSGKERLEENQGMLFDFGSSTSVTPGFWMKDMKFSLDIVWIQNRKIIGITKNVPAPAAGSPFNAERAPVYFPPALVNQVLEVNAGWSEKYGIKVGDQVEASH